MDKITNKSCDDDILKYLGLEDKERDCIGCSTTLIDKKMLVMRHPYGNISVAINGLLHNEFGPARLEFNVFGNLECVYYFKENKLHRPFNPAVISYDKFGAVTVEKYYINGKLHNSVGPACRIKYQNDIGNRWFFCYYINGFSVSHKRIFDNIERGY